MKKTLLWAVIYNPFVFKEGVKVIMTEIMLGKPSVILGYGFLAYDIITPYGSRFFFDGISGGLLPGRLDKILSDLTKVMGEEPTLNEEEFKKVKSELRHRLLVDKENAVKQGQMMHFKEFWTVLHNM